MGKRSSAMIVRGREMMQVGDGGDSISGRARGMTADYEQLSTVECGRIVKTPVIALLLPTSPATSIA
jgi:hypothetical protein